LLIDGPEFFPRMLQAIMRAEFRLTGAVPGRGRACADAVVDALEQAARRGARVRCLFDDYGSLPSAPLRQRLLDAGVYLRWYNRLRWKRGLRNLYRDHRKLLLVDERWAVVGGRALPTSSGRR
jgi:phosphatidylserine/phosphatidylglycerophosphate/cardiolipin synthase-like enzyme